MAETVRFKAIRSSFIVGGGRFANQGLQFIRGVILARILTQADFGTASLFAMTISFLDMITNLSVSILMIQSPHGDEPQFQKTAHTIRIFRGLGIALIIFLGAGPIAKFFAVPEVTWAFRTLALAPFIGSLFHLDVQRYKRSLRFMPSVLEEFIPMLVSVIIAWPLAVWLKNYSVILWLIIIRSIVAVVVSHSLAERRFSVGWNSALAKRMFSFGLPLLLNGVLLFFLFQGDRFVIGSAEEMFGQLYYSKALLGIYVVAATIAKTPMQIVWTASSQLFLPLLSQVQNSEKQFEKRYRFCIQFNALTSCVIAVPFILLSHYLVYLIFGSKYIAAVPLVAWLCASDALRITRAVPMIASYSKGDSQIPTIANFFLGAYIVLALYAASQGWNVIWIAASNIVGEVLALVVCLFLVKRRVGIPVKYYLKPFTFLVASLALTAVMINLGLRTSPLWVIIPAVAALTGVVFVLFLIVFPGFWNEVRLTYRMVQERRAEKKAAAAEKIAAEQQEGEGLGE
jgi:O-antigen/teichoic acid export membrane protein